MLPPNWRMSASDLAAYARKKLSNIHRGSLVIHCTGDGSMVVGVFGNDNYAADRNTRREVEKVRQQLRDANLEELGFGLAPDCSSWALLVRPARQRFQTKAGQAFQLELIKAYLDDLLQGTQPAVPCPC
ncbi:MAG: hypothetical protein NZ700_10490 [Gemmataceae bacterium]|nr:hypothetical protein [Gemmataceae bacterium]MDW8265836.1 hypothetical protein [Gemmataceae bacterium]